MDKFIGINDLYPSVSVASTLNQFKSFKVSELSDFVDILCYNTLNQFLRIEDFYNLLTTEELDKINDFMFTLRHSPNIALCGNLGDANVFVGNLFTGGDSATVAELEKIKGILNTMIDFIPFNYSQIFIDTFKYGNRT